MHVFVGIHLALVMAVSIALWAGDAGDSLSFFLGGFLTLANVGVLYFAWGRAINKNSRILASSVIALKYAFLIFVIFKVTTSGFLSPLWFGVGFASVTLTSVLWALIKSTSKE